MNAATDLSNGETSESAFLGSRLPLYIAGGLVALKFIYLGFPNLFPEEAYYWLYARHLDFGYLDHPPMVAWLIALGTAIFGTNEFGVRFFALVCSVMTTFFAYRLTNLLHGRRAAMLAALAVQVLPYYFLSGFVMTPDAPLMACWAGMLFSLASVIFDRRASAWWGVGVCLGLGMLSKYTIALLGPATLLFLALDPASRRWFRSAFPYAAVGLAAVIFSPVMVWNWIHHWASFAFQTTGRARAKPNFALHELLGSIFAVLTPVGVWLATLGIWRTEDRRRRLFGLVFTLVPLTVFAFFSLRHHVKLNWTGPLWLASIPGLAAALVAAADAGKRVSLNLWRATVAVCAVAYVLVLHHLAFGLPGVGYVHNIELMPVGWPEMAREVTQMKEAAEADTRTKIYVVGMDRNFLASELSFYQPDRQNTLRETTGVHLFESTALMYSYWFPPARFEGATLLLIGLTKHEVESQRVDDHCAVLGAIETHPLYHRGRLIRNYYTRLVSGYHVLANKN